MYISDLNFDKNGNPVILYLTSRGPDAGPEDGPRQWYTAWWTGKKWRINPVTTSDNNYDGKRYRRIARLQENPAFSALV